MNACIHTLIFVYSHFSILYHFLIISQALLLVYLNVFYLNEIFKRFNKEYPYF